jgi:hypothetical protein
MDHSAGLRGGVGSSSIRPTLSVTREKLSRMGTARRKRTLDVRVVLVGFSSAGCTSIQITTTLRYE